MSKALQVACGLVIACLLCVAAEAVTGQSLQRDASVAWPQPSSTPGGDPFDCFLAYLDDLADCRSKHCQQSALFWFEWEVCDKSALLACALEANEDFQKCLGGSEC